MRPDVTGWRRWTWLVIGWTALSLFLAVSSVLALGDACQGLEDLGWTVCQVGAVGGTFLYVFFIFWIWLIVLLLLMLGWFARRPQVRLCPPYGHPVAQGRTTCARCGYDFLAAAVASQTPVAAQPPVGDQPPVPPGPALEPQPPPPQPVSDNSASS